MPEVVRQTRPFPRSGGVRRGQPTARARAAALVVLGVTSLAVSSCHRSATDSNKESPRVIDADSLLVNVVDVERISGVGNLGANPRADTHHPRSPQKPPPGACRVLDPTVTFGSDWTQFRSAVYNRVPPPSAPPAPRPGASALAPAKPLLFAQSVGIYPDERAARAAFDRLPSALEACSALHARYYDFRIDQPDRSTVILEYPSGARDVFHTKSSALIHVDAAGFAHPNQVAAAVVQMISDRI